MAFRVRLDVKITTPPGMALPIYIGTEDKAASTAYGWPLRLEAVHRASPDAAASQSVTQWTFLSIPDVKSVADYHDYVVTFERPPSGVVGFRIYWYGRAFASAWVDSVKVRSIATAVSPDGLRWTWVDPILTGNNSDTQNILHYNPDPQRYVLYTRQQVHAPLAWRGGDLAALRGRSVRLRVDLFKADLF